MRFSIYPALSIQSKTGTDEQHITTNRTTTQEQNNYSNIKQNGAWKKKNQNTTTTIARTKQNIKQRKKNTLEVFQREFRSFIISMFRCMDIAGNRTTYTATGWSCTLPLIVFFPVIRIVQTGASGLWMLVHWNQIDWSTLCINAK